jgi:hypothetical protein
MGELLKAYNTVNERKRHVVIEQLNKFGITHADGVDLRRLNYNQLVYILAMERVRRGL